MKKAQETENLWAYKNENNKGTLSPTSNDNQQVVILDKTTFLTNRNTIINSGINIARPVTFSTC